MTQAPNIPVSPFPWLQNTDRTLYLFFAYIRRKLASCGYQSSSNLAHQDAESTKTRQLNIKHMSGPKADTQFSYLHNNINVITFESCSVNLIRHERI